jgi:hypothetical protein
MTGETNSKPADNTAMPHLRRNFVLGVINGALFTFAETLTDPSLVIAWFLANLSASNFLIGLIVPLRDAGWYLPQLFTSRKLSSQAYKMPLYSDMAIVRVVAWIVITAAAFMLRSPGALIACFLVMYTIYSLTSGVAGLPFMDITAKTIPPRQRGAYFGERLFWGGLLSIGAGYFVEMALGGRLGLSFPANVGALMLGTTLTSTIALILFTRVVEPPDPAPVEMAGLWDHLRLAMQVPGQDRNFGLYLIARIALMIGSIATPFLAVYATQTLGANPGMLGIYLGARTAASLISNRWWGKLADQNSGRLVMQLSASQALAAMLIALGLVPFAQALALPRNLWPWIYAPVFILLGGSTAAIGVAGNSLMLNLSPDNRRAIYVGFANTVLGIALLLTALGGLVVDLAGYQGVFALAAACCVLGMVAVARMKNTPEEAQVWLETS